MNVQTTIAKPLTRLWWMILVRGALVVLFGILLMLRPGTSLAALLPLFGALVLADGLGNTVVALVGREEDDHWWVLLLAGLAGIGVGILAFLNPGAPALVLLFYIAIWAMVTGALLDFADATVSARSGGTTSQSVGKEPATRHRGSSPSTAGARTTSVRPLRWAPGRMAALLLLLRGGRPSRPVPCRLRGARPPVRPVNT
jgi:uncharacterized membrane protein HdeD (DUF308 family)